MLQYTYTDIATHDGTPDEAALLYVNNIYNPVKKYLRTTEM
jgi:hypothetical protein